MKLVVIHGVMRRDGRDLYTFRVVDEAPNESEGERKEYALVTKLRVEGKRVLNVYPRLPQHGAPRDGRFVGVVVNGEVQPL